MLLVLKEGIKEVLLNKSSLLKQLEVKVVDFESKRDVKLASFLVRALEALPGLICDHLVELDLLADL